VIVFHLLDETELTFPFTNLTSFVDCETNQRIQVDPRTLGETYRREMQAFLDRYRNECGSRGIDEHGASAGERW